MKLQLGVYLLFFMIVGAAMSCNVDNEEEPIIIPFIEDEFYLDLWQNLTPNGSELEVHFFTLEEENCQNAEVLSSLRITGRFAILTLFEILAPETCIPGQAPATGKEVFSEVSNNTYNFTVELKDVVENTGSLTVTSETFSVSTPTNGIQWRHGSIQRIPTQALWGYISYSSGEEQVKAQALHADLAGLTVPSSLADGYYGHFTLANDTQTIEVSGQEEELTYQSFIVESTLSDSEIEAWLSRFDNTASEGMQLQLWAGNGQQWTR